MTAKGRVVVVGLGPAGADLIVPRARAAIERIPHRYARTGRHPAMAELEASGIGWQTFDHLYDTGESFDAVYAAIVDALVRSASENGEACYAVPGSPNVAERTVGLLRERARAGRVEVEVVAGLSFADLAWASLDVDPLHGARVVDARGFAVEAAGATGPLLIAQCDTRLVLSDVKLALLDSLDADHTVTVLQRLGLPGEAVFDVALADLDRAFEPDHLTSVFVDTAAAMVAPELARLVALAERLRGPGGCPWDAAQTHHSLARHVLEEAYEVVEAIERLPAEAPGGDEPALADDYAAFEDELGDLLFQVVIHAVLAAEAGQFTIADVARGIHDKLVRRHPHVFGDVTVRSADDVVTNWEQIKKEEKGAASLLEGLTPGLPSLLYVHKLLRKAESVGLLPGAHEVAMGELESAVHALRSAGPTAIEQGLGEVLAAAVAVARGHGIDAESSLRGWARRFRDRFMAMERIAEDRGVALAGAAADTVASLWAEVGASTGRSRSDHLPGS